jgi:hypothetical protein
MKQTLKRRRLGWAVGLLCSLGLGPGWCADKPPASAAALAATAPAVPTASAARPAASGRALILGLVAPPAQLQQLQKRLRKTARVPILKLAALSPQQLSLTLQCTSTRQCDAAQARLVAATSWVRSVDVDATRTRPTPAAAPAARSL